jgi:phenylacetate-CoA ligase
MRWRRTAEAERVIEDTLKRDHWTAAQWKVWLEERLAYVLHRAATRVPYYREQWETRRRRGDDAPSDVLENWPILGKAAVRANPRAFLADDCHPRRMMHDHIGGTIETPIEIWRSRSAVATLCAIAEARTRRWDGIPPGVPWARIGAQPVTPVSRRRPPFWVWNAAMRQLYLSSFHLAPDLIPEYLDALARYRIEYITGHPSSLQALARYILRIGPRTLRMAAIYTNTEPLLPHQREVIAEAFQCPVRETYGTGEAVMAASECAAGRLHLWPEVGHTESTSAGELVCTSLLNTDMPLIRYRTGTRGTCSDDPCTCGRSLPTLAPLDERIALPPEGLAALGAMPREDGAAPHAASETL